MLNEQQVIFIQNQLQQTPLQQEVIDALIESQFEPKGAWALGGREVAVLMAFSPPQE